MLEKIVLFKENQIIKAILFALVLFLLFETRTILMLLFTSYILMSSLLPFVKALEKNKIPKTLAIAIPFFIFISIIVLLVVSVVPFINLEIRHMFIKFPSYLQKATNTLGIDLFGQGIVPEVTTLGRNALKVTTRVFEGLLSFVTIFVITFYLLLDYQRIHKAIVNLFPENKHNKVSQTLEKIEDQLGSWLLGQLILSVSMGVIIWILLSFLRLEFALPLAVIAGLLEFLPTIGPIIASIPAIIVGFTVSPTMAVTIAIAFTLIQFMETHVLVPNIMRKALGIHPIIIIISIITGGKLLGVLGALLAVPFVSFLIILIKSTQE